MKLYFRISQLSISALFLIILHQTAYSQSYNLTGTWNDENGVTYCIRQIEDNLFWNMDDRPRVHNVYYGIIAGGYVSGQWADLPGGQKSGGGGLSLRIESNNRFVKIGQTRNYLGSTWTRTDNTGCELTRVQYDLSGIWYDYTPATGNKGAESRIIQYGDKLTFINEFGDSSEGNFLDEMTIVAVDWEGGLTATLNDNGRQIEWRNGSVWQRSKR